MREMCENITLDDWFLVLIAAGDLAVVLLTYTSLLSPLYATDGS